MNCCQFLLRLMLVTWLTTFQLAQASSESRPAARLNQAIEQLSARSGPPGAQKLNSALTPLSLIEQNLWARLRNNFEFNHLEHPTIEAQVAFMQRGLQSLRSNLIDAAPFLFFIVDEIDRAGLPLDIALLPLVESAFDPRAESSQNAAGLWQFIPATARDFGLTRNEWYDGRNDIVMSTQAATRYLKRLHKTFDGDWLLALAAYNTGPGNVRAAMNRASRKGLEPSFWNLKLARETRDYVPRLIAVNKMITSPEAYGLSLPTIDNKKIIDTVAIGRPISLASAAKLANVSVNQIRTLNPGYLQGQIPQGGPYHLTLPAQASRALLSAISMHKLNSVTTSNLNNHTAGRDYSIRPHTSPMPDSTTAHDTPVYAAKPYKKYVYKTHSVQSGDNLWDISRTLQTDVDTLMSWNNRSEDSAKLQPGEKMMVAFMDEEEDEDLKQKLINYRVRANDTLISITDRFNVSVSKLKKWNPALWDKNQLQPGQAIKIPIQTSKGF